MATVERPPQAAELVNGWIEQTRKRIERGEDDGTLEKLVLPSLEQLLSELTPSRSSD